jgi:hypothetical protein
MVRLTPVPLPQGIAVSDKILEMNVGVSIEFDISIDACIDTLMDVVTDLDDALKAFFLTKEYGEDIENLSIGIVLASQDRPHRLRQLKYREHVLLEKLRLELHNLVEYDIEPSFAVFGQLSPIQARAYLVRALVQSTSVLDRHRERFPDFDVEKFKQDLRECLSRELPPS